MEELKHECGVAIVRLLKPLEFYHRKYGTWMYGLNKLYLLMEKQHNRGQEGAGLACIKLHPHVGEEYMFRERATGTGAIAEIFSSVHRHYKNFSKEELNDPTFAKAKVPFAGELYLGHLRYSTTGMFGISYVHPFLRRNNWRARNLLLCGNFNLTNVDEVFRKITSTGQHPRDYSDTYIMLEQMGHRLDREVERLFTACKEEGKTGVDMTDIIEQRIDLSNVLRACAPDWDGGFVIGGMTGSGETFAVRDPWGIRPAFYYADEEIVVLASERPVIQTVMNIQSNEVVELQRGEALLINKGGEIRLSQIVPPGTNSACSFERIYFSRGSDVDIYKERKRLGSNLVQPILRTVDYDLRHTVFSFIPNTAEVAYYGMLEGLDNYLNKLKKDWIADRSHLLQEEELEQILSLRIRTEKVALKDIKLRTFIAEGQSRNDLAAHVYDITYGSLQPFVDNLVVIDDSIVRGTTLRQSIIHMLNRLRPKKIVIVSSSPQVRYPDYYGIDMSRMNEFIAFKAAVALLEDRGTIAILQQAYEQAKEQEKRIIDGLQNTPLHNYVQDIYIPFTDTEISAKMAEMLTSPAIQAKIEIVYQTIDGLRAACPNHPGDWYFSGNYPTPGGTRMVNRALIAFMEEDYLCREGHLDQPSIKSNV
ncbi:MAG: amidophosphoribosyltransferase [Tannerellaceae bacterium]|jgi:amidophosphoribosyltransferase|nr:amidophosphoribosyltransferase [Tannerellaceae bacterium]